MDYELFQGPLTGIRVLIADADAAVREIVQFSVQEAGWACSEARDGIAAIKLFRRQAYSLAILDVELPEINGKIVCAQFRKTARIPVIFLSVHRSEENRLAAFDAGGNDYVVKPFYPRELIARARSLISLTGHMAETRHRLAVGPLRIDLDSHLIHLDDALLQLTPREYDLLLFFCQNPNRAFSRNLLLDAVWGEQFIGTDRTVDTHVKSLREKIKPYHNHIVTVWGYGYKFEV